VLLDANDNTFSNNHSQADHYAVPDHHSMPHNSACPHDRTSHLQKLLLPCWLRFEAQG